MIVRINSVEQAENIFNLIAENEMLRAVAENCTEFNNIDAENLDLDIDQVESVAQLLVDIANCGLMTGYNGFIYTHRNWLISSMNISRRSQKLLNSLNSLLATLA